MLRQAREETGMNRELASCLLHIGSRTLASYERGETMVPPDVLLKMAEVYNRFDMPAAYCSSLCPIGQRIAHRCERNDLATSVLGLINELAGIDRVKRDLITVAADGRICSEELPLYKDVISELIELEGAIAEAKQVAARKGIDLAKLMGNEKTPVQAAL